MPRTAPALAVDDEGGVVDAGSLRARIRRGAPWELRSRTTHGGGRYTTSGHKSVGYMKLAPGAPGRRRARGRRRHHDDGPRRGIRVPAHAALARRRRARLRARRAVRPAREERPDRRHLERRRRHLERAGLQERAVLPHEPRLRRAREPRGARVVRGRLGGRRAGAVLGRGGVPRVLRDRRDRRRPRCSTDTRGSRAGRRACPTGRTGCGSRRASRPTTTRRRSTRSSTAWPSATSRSRCSTSTASGCASSTGPTSSGTRRCSPTPRACSRGCTSAACA